MSASIHFHLSRDELLVGADGVGADDATTYLTVENDTSSVEVTVFGTPEELHAFALLLLAAVEVKWDIECRSAGLMHRPGCDHEATS